MHLNHSLSPNLIFRSMEKPKGAIPAFMNISDGKKREEPLSFSKHSELVKERLSSPFTYLLEWRTQRVCLPKLSLENSKRILIKSTVSARRRDGHLISSCISVYLFFTSPVIDKGA